MSLSALRDIPGPAGRLEVRVDEPERDSRAVAIVAPPHPQLGGRLQDRVVYHVAQGLVRIGCVVWRFNFRGVGTSEGSFGNGSGEMDDLRAVVERAAESSPGLPVWSAGYSFGAWVATMVGAADPRVTTLIAVAAGVGAYDYSPLAASTKPKFLIHGERDELAPLKDVRRFYATLPEPKELIVIDGADHLFDGHASEIADAVGDLLGET
jgi:alpha/beta superfamily hydrolase